MAYARLEKATRTSIRNAPARRGAGGLMAYASFALSFGFATALLLGFVH